MINIQDYVNPTRTGRAGLRIATISQGSGGFFKVTLATTHSAPRFSPSDEKKSLVVIAFNADGSNLYTTIKTFSSETEVELAAPAPATFAPISRLTIAWWDNQDDTSAFNNAQRACDAGNGILYCPGDVYIISSPLVASQNLQSIIGDGAGETFFVCTPLLTGGFLSVSSVPPWFSVGGAPTQGFTILGPGFRTPAMVTAWSVASNVATFTANNNFEVGQQVLLQGFIGADSAKVNNVSVAVLEATSTQFTANLTAADGKADDTGVASLDWSGIATSSADWISIANIEIQAFAGDAVQIKDTIVSDFRKVIMSHCGQGFNDLSSVGQGGGTSLNFDTCYANGNYKAGYYVSRLAYSSFNNCAADHNGVAYYLDRAESVSFNGSGSEVQLYRNAAYPGYSYYFHGANGCALNCPYATSSPDSVPGSTHLVFDSGAKSIFVNCFKENTQSKPNKPPKPPTPPVPPTNVFTIDNTCSNVTIWEPVFAKDGTGGWTDEGTNDTIYLNGRLYSALVSASDFSLSADWGDGAAFDLVAGSFAMGSFHIKAGSDRVKPNPTVTFTFPALEIRSHNPSIVWSRFDGSITQTGYWLVSSISNAGITWVFVGTPGAGENIGLQWIASNRA